MKKTISSAIFVLALVCVGVSFNSAPAEAACSYNGYINSGGTCAKSFKTKHYYKDDHNDDDDDHYYRPRYNNDDRVDALEAYIKQLQRILDELLGRVNDDDDFDVSTRAATDIESDEAIVRGRVAFGDSDEATVYFEYGRDRGDLDRKTTEVELDDSDNENFARRLINLREDTTYYFRAVAEDEDGDKERGAILSFRTDEDDSNDEAPDADTDAARDITDDSAELRGSVDMNDFTNGRVFFVYGEDEDQVEDIVDEYDEYSDIDEDGDDLQKVLVDNDLDSSDDYREDVDGLDNDTDIFFSICVEYEDEDDDLVIECGGVEKFTTDK